VVKENKDPNTEYIVPVDDVKNTAADKIQIDLTKAELEQKEPFIKTTYIKEKVQNPMFGYSGGMYGVNSYYYLPYVRSETSVYEEVDNKQIPDGDLAIHRGTRVEARDGSVGKVDEFVVNPENNRITPMVMREGHLWGKKDVIIPISVVSETLGDTVYLKLNKKQVEDLPVFPLHQRWA
jgi:sporulation protein YlmC with PRC-barrel domain